MANNWYQSLLDNSELWLTLIPLGRQKASLIYFLRSYFYILLTTTVSIFIINLSLQLEFNKLT